MAPNRIDIGVLRDVTNRIFDFIEKELQMKSVEVPQNFYWSISDDQLYDMTSKPKEVDCGSLADDYEFISSSHKSANDAIPLELIHIAPLLNALAKAVPSYKPPPKQ
jgi:hypothetical protein